MAIIKLNVHYLNRIGKEPCLIKKEDNGLILKVSTSSITLTEDGDSESFNVTSKVMAMEFYLFQVMKRKVFLEVNILD